MFYSGRILFYLNTPIVKVWGNSSRTQHPLRSGTVRRQCPSLKGSTWCNKGRVSASRTIFVFYVENTNIHRMKWKMLCYNLVYDRSSLSPLNHIYTICTHRIVRYSIITTRTYKWLEFGPHKACWFDTLAHFSPIQYYVMKWRRFSITVAWWGDFTSQQVEFAPKDPEMRNFDDFFIVSLKNLKQESEILWIETLMCRHWKVRTPTEIWQIRNFAGCNSEKVRRRRRATQYFFFDIMLSHTDDIVIRP